jgi:hypothetical protein
MTPRSFALAFGASFALLTPFAHADGDADVQRLANGQAQKSTWQPPGTTERYGHAEVLVHAPIAVVHKAVMDYGHYKDIDAEKFHNTRIIGKEGGGTDVYMQLPIMNGMVTLWQVMRFHDLKPLARGWAVVEGWFVRGNLRTSNAAWTMHAVDDNYTVLKFDLLLGLNVPAPQGAVDEELRDAAEKAVNAIRDKSQGTPGPVPYAP